MHCQLASEGVAVQAVTTAVAPRPVRSVLVQPGMIISCTGPRHTTPYIPASHLQARCASAGLGEAGEEVEDEVLVASVQQAVGLVQDEVLDAGQAQLPALHQVLDPPCTQPQHALSMVRIQAQRVAL